MVQMWPRLCLYAFPPIVLLPGVLERLALSGTVTQMRVRPLHKKRLVYGHILIYKCHKFTRAFPFLHKGLSWQSVLSLRCRMSAGHAHARASDRRNRQSGVKLVLFSIFVTHSAINGNNSKSTCQKKSKQCDRQKGKVDHVSQPS